MLVRRTFLADVTEHVYWGAINRLLLTCGLALAVHGLYAGSSFGNALFFIIAFTPRIFITQLRKTASKALSDDGKVADELPIQMVQGIDIWKEQRLEEEGIESIQNLATADILTLAVKNSLSSSYSHRLDRSSNSDSKISREATELARFGATRKRNRIRLDVAREQFGI